MFQRYTEIKQNINEKENIKEKNMNRFMIILALVLGMVGCASQSDLEALRNDVTENHALAMGAQQTASNAAQCCLANRQAMDKMYSRLMTK